MSRGQPKRQKSALDSYLEEVSRVPLLTVKEEKELTRKIALENEKLRRDLKKAGIIFNKKISRLIEKHATFTKSEQHLITANLPLVVSIAKNYIILNKLHFLDLIQEGNLGLFRAVRRFNWKRGYKFSTYATYWIRNYILTTLNNDGRTVRIPKVALDEVRDYKNTEILLSLKLRRQPSLPEIAKATNLPLQKVFQIRATQDQMAPFENVTGRDTAHALEEKNTPVITVQDHRLLKETLEKALNPDTRDGAIILMRYGFYDGRTYTLKQMGELFGLTRERVRQIEETVFKRLRTSGELKVLENACSLY